MDNQKNSFILWIKANKKQLVIAGISITAITAVIFGIKNREVIIELWESMKRTVGKTPHTVENEAKAPVSTPIIETVPIQEIQIVDVGDVVKSSFDVSEHVRNLHIGWNASAEKIAEAEAMGIILQSGQTLVNAYTKGNIAA